MSILFDPKIVSSLRHKNRSPVYCFPVTLLQTCPSLLFFFLLPFLRHLYRWFSAPYKIFLPSSLSTQLIFQSHITEKMPVGVLDRLDTTNFFEEFFFFATLENSHLRNYFCRQFSQTSMPKIKRIKLAQWNRLEKKKEIICRHSSTRSHLVSLQR